MIVELAVDDLLPAAAILRPLAVQQASERFTSAAASFDERALEWKRH